MDKRNFVFNYVMKKSDFDHFQNDVEIGLNRLGDTIAGKGIVSGLEVTLSGNTAEISSGVAFDGSGKRIELASSTTVDIGSIVRPATGKIKWITLVLKHGYREQGTLTDGHNKTWPERILDSYETEILEGTQAAEANATKPSVSSNQVVLIDIKADHSTPWASLVTDTGRRPTPGGLFSSKDYVKDYMDMTPLWNGVLTNTGPLNLYESFDSYHFLLARISLAYETGYPNSRIGNTIIPTKTIILFNEESNTYQKSIALGVEDITHIRFLTNMKAYFTKFHRRNDNALLGIYGLGRKS